MNFRWTRGPVPGYNGKNGKGSAMGYYAEFSSVLGRLTLVSDGEALTGLYLPGQNFDTGGLSRREDLPVFRAASDWLRDYFAGKFRPVTFPLLPEGNVFRQRVWSILLTIPPGQTRTYGSIAREISDKMSAQAVGGAVGRNPISIMIPCHRCVGADGSLTGYAGGLEAKKFLLKLEDKK